MQLPKDIHERLAAEFRFAGNKIVEVSDLATKLYYFSAYFGEIQRALNYSWSSDLATLHLVLTAAHGSIKGRLDMLVAGVERIGFPENFNETFNDFAQDCAALVESDEIDDEAFNGFLRRASTLTYAVTGNGYYLLQKGVLTLDGTSEPARPS